MRVERGPGPPPDLAPEPARPACESLTAFGDPARLAEVDRPDLRHRQRRQARPRPARQASRNADRLDHRGRARGRCTGPASARTGWSPRASTGPRSPGVDHVPDRQGQEPERPDREDDHHHLVRLRQPDRQRQGQRAAQDGQPRPRSAAPPSAPSGRSRPAASPGPPPAGRRRPGSGPGPAGPPSLPRTTSRSVRSVTITWASVPRALSRQIAPAVAAGAASRTSESWMIVIVVEERLARPATSCWRVVRFGVRRRRPPDHPQARQQGQHEQPPERVRLPAPRTGSATRRRRPAPGPMPAARHRTASRPPPTSIRGRDAPPATIPDPAVRPQARFL